MLARTPTVAFTAVAEEYRRTLTRPALHTAPITRSADTDSDLFFVELAASEWISINVRHPFAPSLQVRTGSENWKRAITVSGSSFHRIMDIAVRAALSDLRRASANVIA